MLKTYLPFVNLVLILGLGVYVLTGQRQESKKVYVLNQRVFDEFAGKKELEQKLGKVKAANKVQLDSIERLAQQNPQNQAYANLYQQTARAQALQEEQMSAQYTADIWKRINQHLAEYGKAKGYDFIFGASGDGSLMYAAEGNNITGEVVNYLNERYEKGN